MQYKTTNLTEILTLKQQLLTERKYIRIIKNFNQQETEEKPNDIHTKEFTAA
jgi:hypothetical protein